MSVIVAEGVVVVTADAKDVPRDLERELTGAKPKVARAGRDTADDYLDEFKRMVAAGGLDDEIRDEIRDAGRNSGRFGREAGGEYADGFDDDLDEIGRDIRREVDDASDGVGRSGKRAGSGWVDSFKGSFLGAGLANVAVAAATQIGEIIGSGIRAAWDFGWSSIEVASGLAEADTALNQVFGSGAGAVGDFAKGASRSAGQSELAAKKAAQGFGIYGKAAGLADDANAAFSTGLVTLAADFASFYDTSPEQAIEAIGAALRGESEPIRAYGVLLDDATLKNRALRMGLIDTTNEALTPQQRVLAAHAEILEQADVAAGDFVATSDGLSNQQRILAAEFENAKGKLGESLLPVMLELVTFANDRLMPALSDVIDKVGPELGEALIESMPSLIDFLDAFVEALPEMTEMATTALPLIIQAGTVLIPILTFLADGASNWFKWMDIIFDLFTGDSSVADITGKIENLDGVLGWVGEAARGAGRGFGDFISWIQRTGFTVADGVKTIIDTIGGMPGKIQGAVVNAGFWLYNSGKAVIQGFINGIKNMIGDVGRAVEGVVGYVRGFFPQSPAKRGPFSGQGWTRLKKSGGAVIEQWAEGMREANPDVPFDLMGITPPGTGSAGRPSFAADAMTPGVSAPVASSSGYGPINLNVTSPDPELAGRQFARGMSKRLGMR